MSCTFPTITLHDAETLEEAAELVKRHGSDARLLAGGTDLFVDLKTKRVDAGHLVSLQRITSLRGIEETPDGLRIGALTTVSQLNRSDIHPPNGFARSLTPPARWRPHRFATRPPSAATSPAPCPVPIFRPFSRP